MIAIASVVCSITIFVGCSPMLKPVCQFKDKKFIEGAAVVLAPQEQLCICGAKQWTCISQPGIGSAQQADGGAPVDGSSNIAPNNNTSPPPPAVSPERFDDDGF
jgi:hypothetical protein